MSYQMMKIVDFVLEMDYLGVYVTYQDTIKFMGWENRV